MNLWIVDLERDAATYTQLKECYRGLAVNRYEFTRYIRNLSRGWELFRSKGVELKRRDQYGSISI